MMVLVSYDVSTIDKEGRCRLRIIAKHCLDFGQRVQNSVFECDVDPGQWETLKGKLLKVYKKEEDSLRFYFLGSNWERRVEHFGTGKTFSRRDTIIV
jgi:CRISPR-associated protein Cas2